MSESEELSRYMAKYKTRYFKSDAGGLVRQNGPFCFYLDKNGLWIEEDSLLLRVTGANGDSDCEEITIEEARRIVEGRGGKL